MPVQEPEHKAPMFCHPVQGTFFVAVSPTLPVLELLQDGGVVLLWCLAISYSCFQKPKGQQPRVCEGLSCFATYLVPQVNCKEFA